MRHLNELFESFRCLIEEHSKLADSCFSSAFRCSMILSKIKMYLLSEEERWYIISKWKEGAKSVRQIARFHNCHLSTVYRINNHYQSHGDLNCGCGSGHPPARDPTQVKNSICYSCWIIVNHAIRRHWTNNTTLSSTEVCCHSQNLYNE